MRTKVSLSAGFGVLLAALLFLDVQNIVLWALLACLLHELGHYAAIRALRGHVASLRLSVVGAEMTPARARMFSYREELFIVIAGPLASLLAAGCSVLLARYSGAQALYLFCGINVLLGLFNLLPVMPLDGGRIARILVMQAVGEAAAEQTCAAVTLVCSVLLLFFGIYLLHQGGNFTLILTALWLLAGREQNLRGGLKVSY